MRSVTLPSIIACILAGLTARAQAPGRETVERLKRATVYIQLIGTDYFSEQKITSSGSGFFVNPHGYVMTNWHVVRPFRPGFLEMPFPQRQTALKVFSESGKPQEEVLNATVIAVDKKRDLALLATGKKNSVYLEFGDPQTLIETNPLWVAGFPLGEKFAVIERGPEVSVGRGAVTALRHDDLERLYAIQTDAQFDSGNSGGPLIVANGKVMGIAQSIVVNHRSLNFAVPSSFAAAMVKEAHIDRPWQAKGKVTFCAPAGAEIFLDGEKLGSVGAAPLVAEIRLGLHQIAVAHPDHPIWISQPCLRDGATVTATLHAGNPRRIHALSAADLAQAPQPAALSNDDLPACGEALLTEDFDNREILKRMEQSTGGGNTHTWYVKDGELHQHESNGLLHAIYAGDPQWADFAFSADVRIKNEENDSRAGLIFRESERGFYLFRIHRETDTAQLAYHCKQPFGWFVLGERKLPVDITEKPFRLQVLASGPNLSCLLDGQALFRVRDELSSRGRIGFYSVESQAAFDKVRVEKLVGGKPNAERAAHYQMFWFTDTFGETSSWWSLRQGDGQLSRPWLYTDVGGVAVYGDPLQRIAAMENFILTNFMADLLFKLAKTAKATDPRFGFVFGRRFGADGRHEYRLVISGKDRRCRLLQVHGEQETVLHDQDLAMPEKAPTDKDGEADEGAFGTFEEQFFAASIQRLLLRVDGRSVKLQGMNRELFAYDFGDQPIAEGTFGILTQETDAIFYQLTIANPKDAMAKSPPEGKGMRP